MRDNIVLIGFMGCGKTTIGTKLAHILNYEFLDTDQYIEEHQKMKITEIFKERGEQAFRSMETECLRTFSQSIHHTILSTGGGMPLFEENARLLKETGLVLYLKTSAEDTYLRLRGDTTRPLLQTDDPLSAIQNMIKQRDPLYQKVADHVIVTNDCSLDSIIDHITKLI